MSDFTPRASLRLPGGGSTGIILPDEQVDIDVLNDNFRKIDALLGARNIPSASSYSGSMDGDLVYARDTEYLQMYSATDGRLVTPRHPGAHFYTGTIAQRDAATTSGVIRDGDHWQVTGEANDDSEYVRLSGAWTQGAFACHLTSVQPITGAWTLLSGFTTDIPLDGVVVSGSTVTLDRAGLIQVTYTGRHSGNANAIMSAALTRNTTSAPDLVNSISLVSATANTTSETKIVSVTAGTVLRMWLASTGVSADTMTGLSLRYL